MILKYLNIVRSLFTFFFLQNSKPSYLIFFVTNKCEAKCKHCFYWKEINTDIAELSVNEIKKMAAGLGPMVQVTLTGGSPELRADLPEIIRIFVINCSPINITLCSNGNYPDILFRIVKDILSEFKDLSLTVDISLDGLYEEHDSLRGINGLFSNVKRSYDLLKNLKTAHPNLRLGCGLVVSGFNDNVAVETAEWAINNLPVDNFTPVLVRGEPRCTEALDVRADVFQHISEKVRVLLQIGRFKGYSSFPRIINSKDILQKRIIYQTYLEKKQIIRCNALRETAVIYPDGKISCCELRSESPGSIREFNMNIKSVWRSQIVKDLRKKIKAGKCFCWHQCFLSGSIIKSRSMWFQMVKLLLNQ